MSRIWIINQYASIPKTGVGGRHRHLARELAARGHGVTIVAASWTHLHPRDLDPATLPFKESFEGFTFVHLPVPRYRDAHDKARVRNWLLFSAKLLTLPKRLGEKPDVILVSSPSPFPFLAAERLARRHGARLIFEVRDIWPLSLMEIGGYGPRNPLIRAMQWIEDRAYRNSDAVISNLPHADDHMVARGMARDKFTWVPNGFSQSEVSEPTPLAPEIDARIPKDRFIIGYAGTLGEANALEYLVEAATQLRDCRDVSVVIVGRGRSAEAIRKRIVGRNLSNVIVLPAVPKAQVPSLLKRFDACYIGWNKVDLYRFGVAANKIFDYLSAGKPILHSYSGRHDYVADYRAGVSTPAEAPAEIAEAIMRLKRLTPAEREAMGASGRAAAYKHHEYANVAQLLETVLLDK